MDDFLVIAKKSVKLDYFIYKLHSKFTIKELGNAKYFLDIRIIRNRDNKKLYLYQDAFIDKILDRYGITNAKPVNTPIASGVLALMVPFNDIAPKKDIEEYSSIIDSLNYLAY